MNENKIAKSISRLDYSSYYLLPFIAAFNDYIAIVLAEKLSLSIHDLFFKTNFIVPDAYFYLWIPAVFIFFMFYTGAHRRMIPFWETVRNTFYASFYSIVASIFMLYLISKADTISRFYLAVMFILSFLLLCAVRQLFVSIFNKLDIMKEPVIFIGAGMTTEHIIKFFQKNNCFGLRIAGVIDDEFRSEHIKKNFRLLANMDKARQCIKNSGVKTVIISTPRMEKHRLINLVSDTQPIVKNIEFVPDVIGAPVANLEIRRLYTEDLVLLNVKNNLASLRSKFIKRVFDLVLGLLICIPVIPILIISAIWIKLDSKGPVFFNAKRIGRNRKLFTCYKFRSMYIDSDKILNDYLAQNPKAKAEWDEFQKLHDYDPRVTRAGRIMRRTSLDELPQILNVLKGEMSLVGPRPYLPRELDKMGKYTQIITTAVPGITGYWQVNGRSDVTFEGRLVMDNWYIRNWSVWMDMVLLFKTFGAVFFSKGAV